MPRMSHAPALCPPLCRALPPVLLHELVSRAGALAPQRIALTHVNGDMAEHTSYECLHQQVGRVAAALRLHDLRPGERVAVYLEKRLQAVVGSFAATAAGGVLVPVNPVLKASQVAHILQDAGVRVLITSGVRLASLREVLMNCPELHRLLVCEPLSLAPPADTITLQTWEDALKTEQQPLPGRLETDVAAILYTSGSTGRPKGVVLSHRNLLAGAASVAGYLGNHADDTLLAALPLSFDAGFSQLTTAFLVGARVVLVNPLLPRDVLQAMAREGVTGLTAVPPLYMQLVALPWPNRAAAHLRYWANTGGRLPRATLQQLRQHAPRAQPFLMYGLTEAFRSTYLAPEEVDRRCDSIGRAIPNVAVHVLREDGSECAVDEPGELVHRGPLVAQGYWRRPEETALRFRPLPAALVGEDCDADTRERVVFSGDTVRRDAEGFLYFVGRRDEMIKTSGYRVSPTEVEEGVFASGLVREVLAVGRDHATLGQCIEVAVVPSAQASGDIAQDTAALLAHCRALLPAYMVPAAVHWQAKALPRNPNGKIDRLRWRAERQEWDRPDEPSDRTTHERL
jgi:acyl-CoA ligase (AMP-forming) (exosortase A-associated)